MEPLPSTFVAPYSFVKKFFEKGHARTIKAKKNVMLLFLVKGGSVGVSLLLVPLTMSYVNTTQYGIWMTLSSVVGWIGFFDIGFGNGLRNKLTECVSSGQFELGKIYVSTTYAILTVFSIVFLTLFISINAFIDWSTVLNAPPEMASELSRLALIIFFFFSVQFVLQLINTILTANHEPAKASILNLVANILSLVMIYLVARNSSGNLSYLAFILSGSPVISMAIFSLWLYRGNYRKFAPSFKFVRFRYAKSLLQLGIKFFIMQIGVLILFQTDNIVISQIFGPEEVTHFNIAFKLFSTLTMVFTIVTTPLWSAYTDAYVNNDFAWIQRTMAKLRKMWLFLILATILLLVLSPFIFKLWLGDSIKVSYTVSLVLSLYTIAYSWQSIQVMFLNGIGKVWLQLWLVIISSLINIPLAIGLSKILHMPGIILSSVILFTVMGIIFSVQVNKIINHKATGIWNQ